MHAFRCRVSYKHLLPANAAVWTFAAIAFIGWAMLQPAADASAATPTVSVRTENNVVQNPSFEQHSKANGLPDAWDGDPKVYQSDASVHHSGKASLRYINMDANHYALCTQRLAVKPGWLVRFGAWIKTKDMTAKSGGATLAIEWNDQAGKWLGGCYGSNVSGTRDWTLVESVTRIPQNAGRVTILCYATKHTTGTAWFDDVYVERIRPTSLDVVVTQPNYRGQLTADSPKEIRACVKITPADYDAIPSDIRLNAFLRDASQKIVAEQKDIPLVPSDSLAASAFEMLARDITLPTGKLQKGEYQLVVEATRNGATLAAASQRIERMDDDFQAHCTIDSHRRLLIDGKPFFPIGMYCSTIDSPLLAACADSKFNCLMPYGSPTKKQMDLAWKQRLHIIYSVKDCYVGHKGCPRSVRSEADAEKWVRSRYKTFRDHPALLAWYLNDELPQSFMPQLNAHQRWAEEDDPNHPTWVVLYQFREIAAYCNSFDAIGTDPYPIGKSPASTVAKTTKETFWQTSGCRAMWQVPQIFNWGNYEKNEPKEKLRTPTIDEVRNMTWQCIAEGATGIVFYSWHDMRRNPDSPMETFWPGVKDVAAELDRMSPVLLSIEPTPKVTAVEAGAAKQPSWLHFTVRRYKGKLYVFAVNDGDGSGRVQFDVGQPVRSVREIRSSRQITPAGAKFDDAFQKLQVAIYEIE